MTRGNPNTDTEDSTDTDGNVESKTPDTDATNTNTDTRAEEHDGRPDPESSDTETAGADEVSDNESDSANDGVTDPAEEETADEPRSSEVETGDEPEEIIPELHDDVHKQPFKGVNLDDPKAISHAVREMSPQAANTIDKLISDRTTYRERAEQYKERAEQKQREFQNFKQRKNNETEEIKDTATKDFIREALPIRDNLTRALEQDSENIRSGVELIKEEFDDLLQKEGLTIVDPEPGTEVDPGIHEVMTRVESDDVNEGEIVECYRPGYIMEDTVVRTARVTVSDG